MKLRLKKIIVEKSSRIQSVEMQAGDNIQTDTAHNLTILRQCIHTPCACESNAYRGNEADNQTANVLLHALEMFLLAHERILLCSAKLLESGC